MANPGWLSVPATFRLSKSRGLVQVILMLIGTLLVPLGTLTVTTGPYIPQTRGKIVLPIPTKIGNVFPLHQAMDENATHLVHFRPSLDDQHSILELASIGLYAAVISLTDQIPNVPSVVGPSPNLTSKGRRLSEHHCVFMGRQLRVSGV